MKINRTYLSKVMSLASRFTAAGKNIHQVYGYVRMQVWENGVMLICATNSKDSIFARLPVTDPTPFVAMVPAIMLSNVLARIDDEEITFKMVKDRFVVVRKGGNFTFGTISENYFPSLPPIDGAGSWITIETQDIHNMVKSLLCGTSEEKIPAKAYQNVARIRSAGPEFIAVATDSSRLAVVDGKCLSEAGIELLVPLSALRAIDASLRDLSGAKTVQIGEDEKQVWIKINDNLQFCFTKLTIKQYPDIDGLLARTEYTMHATTATAELNKVLQLAKVVGDVPIRLELHKGKGLIVAQKAEGEMEQEFEVNQVAPFDLVTGFNLDYLMPIIGQISEKHTELSFSHTPASGNMPESFTLRITEDGERLRSSWIVGSLSRYPGVK